MWELTSSPFAFVCDEFKSYLVGFGTLFWPLKLAKLFYIPFYPCFTGLFHITFLCCLINRVQTSCLLIPLHENSVLQHSEKVFFLQVCLAGKKLKWGKEGLKKEEIIGILNLRLLLLLFFCNFCQNLPPSPLKTSNINV